MIYPVYPARPLPRLIPKPLIGNFRDGFRCFVDTTNRIQDPDFVADPGLSVFPDITVETSLAGEFKTSIRTRPARAFRQVRIVQRPRKVSPHVVSVDPIPRRNLYNGMADWKAVLCDVFPLANSANGNFVPGG